MDNLKDVLEGLQIGWTTTINEKKESRAAQQDFKNIAPDGVYTAILNAEIRNTPKPAVLFKLTILDNEYKDQRKRNESNSTMRMMQFAPRHTRMLGRKAWPPP